MTPKYSNSTFAVINQGCPLDQTVLGSNTVRLVLGDLPDAIELELDYESVRALAQLSTTALKEMRAKFAELYGDDPDDEPLAAPHP